jgi:RNA polymerase sigma factor (sigma-70 family)
MGDRSRVVRAGSRVRLGLASDEWLVACVRRGDTAAFETLYDRHARELLGFCVYMLGSRQDAEDAVQATFTSAYRALRADSRPVSLRPWLFAIARNDCLTILRKRRPVLELASELAGPTDPVDQLEVREELRQVFAGLRELPERQRAALVLAEVHGLSHSEVGDVLGVRAEQVKAFIYQARSTLLSERAARDVDCREIRAELASARGAALLRGRLRRHVRSCPECRSYADGVARQRRQLGALLTAGPSIALRYRAIEEILGVSSSDPVGLAGTATVGATAAEIAGGGVKALVCKVAAGMACLGASAGVGASVLSAPETSRAPSSRVATTAPSQLIASLGAPGSSSPASGAPSWRAEGAPNPGADGVSTGGVPVNPEGDRSALPEVQNGVSDGAVSHGEDGGGDPVGDERTGKNERAAHSPGASNSSGDGEPRASAEQRQAKREAHQLLGETRSRAREERQAASPPPRSAEQIQREREEAAHRHEERKPEGHSRAPKTEEELRVKREHAEQRKAERRKQHEEEKRQQEREAEESPVREVEGAAP